MAFNADSRVTSLIGDVYAAALDATRWQAVLQNMSSMVDSVAGTIFIHDFEDRSATIDGANGNVAAFLGFEASALASYTTHYTALNVWTAAEDALSSGSSVTSSMLFPDSRLKQTEFYSDWLRPQGFFYSLGSVVTKDDSRAVKLSFLRSERAGAYGADELRVMQAVMPHMQSAVAMHRRLHRLESLAGSALAALDSLRIGIILIGGDGRVMHSNQAAQDMARKSGALSLGANGTVQAVTMAVTGRLARLVSDAVRTGLGRGSSPGGGLRLPSARSNGLSVFVTPLPAHLSPFGQTAAAAIFCSDPDAVIGGLASALMSVYQMSPAEAALSEALLNGFTLAEFAEQRCVTLHTVKTQLKSASAKVGAKRQVDLVRVLLTGPVMLKGWPPRHSS